MPGAILKLSLMALFWLASTVMAGETALAELERAVEQTERAFARTMADRDFEAFKRFLSPEAVFFSRDEPLRGSDAVAERWQPFFEGPEAPFSWEPRLVVVLDSGGLALSSGPVLDPEGQCIGSFNSIWRREASGEWKIVFDKGSPDCPP